MKVRFLLKVTAMPALMIGMLASCSNDGPKQESEDNEAQPIELNAKTRATAEQLGDFYVRLTGNVARYIDSDPTAESANFVISPLSASMVMAMMGNAVEGDLREEIIKYLGTEDLDGMNELASTLLNSLPGIDSKTTLTLANSVWVNDRYNLDTEFTALMSDSYGSQVAYFDASDSNGTANEINRWCAKNTGDKIRDFVNPAKINYGLMALMLNAMNFKSEWRERELFDTNDTSEQSFYGIHGESRVYTMTSKWFACTCNFEDDVTYLSLPFGNSAFWLEIVFPNEVKDFEKLPQIITENLADIRNGVKTYNRVKLYLPKFSINGKPDLTEILYAGGLEHLADPANLKLFSTPETGLIIFNQEASFEVDETGAKAVAVSSGENIVTSPAPSEPVEIHIDHPFYFFITERSTGACVVSGRITDL